MSGDGAAARDACAQIDDNAARAKMMPRRKGAAVSKSTLVSLLLVAVFAAPRYDSISTHARVVPIQGPHTSCSAMEPAPPEPPPPAAEPSGSSSSALESDGEAARCDAGSGSGASLRRLRVRCIVRALARADGARPTGAAGVEEAAPPREPPGGAPSDEEDEGDSGGAFSGERLAADEAPRLRFEGAEAWDFNVLLLDKDGAALCPPRARDAGDALPAT